MSNAEIILAALAIVSPIVSVIIAIIVARRNKDKDTKSDGQKEGVLQSDVGYIKSGVDRLEKRLDKMDEKEEDMVQRISKVEVKLETHISDTNAHYKRSSGGVKKQ